MMISSTSSKSSSNPSTPKSLPTDQRQANSETQTLFPKDEESCCHNSRPTCSYACDETGKWIWNGTKETAVGCGSGFSGLFMCAGNCLDWILCIPCCGGTVQTEVGPVGYCNYLGGNLGSCIGMAVGGTVGFVVSVIISPMSFFVNLCVSPSPQ